LREENAKLKEENLALRQREVDELRAEVRERKGSSEGLRIMAWLVGGIFGVIITMAIAAKLFG